MKFIFDIDNDNIARIAKALDHPDSGFVFVQGEGTMAQQKRRFFRTRTKEFWRSVVFNAERAEAISKEPNDTAAEQAKRFTDLTIIDTEE